MNTTTTDKAAEKRARNAAKARERRAAAKAAKVTAEPVGSPSVEAPEDRQDNTEATWQVVTIDGTEVKVKASLSTEDAEKAARKLLGSKAEVAKAAAEEAEVTAKPVKPVKLKGDPLATVFYRLSRTAMEALEGKLGKPYRDANAADWKILKASKRITGGQSWAFTGKLRPEAASALAAALRAIAGTEGFGKPGSLITNAAKLESNHYVTKAAEKR